MGLYKFIPKLNSDKLQNQVMTVLKQGMITLVLFNLYNFSFSTGLHIKYAHLTDKLYILSILSILIVLPIIIIFSLLLVCSEEEDESFGEFKNKFKPSFVNNLYVFYTIIFRIVISLVCVITNEY